jgi:Asp-tRNA(Asn)/Glu-tRNA(Gln) amidotransferase A subunit family amidase
MMAITGGLPPATTIVGASSDAPPPITESAIARQFGRDGPGALASGDMSISTLYEHSDGVEIARAVREREVSPREVLDEAIARAERVNPQLNAIAARRYDDACVDAERNEPSGPFAGVPFLAKDLGPPLAGLPLTMGSRYFKNYVPTEDHEFFRRVKRAGAVIFAKTTAPEFGLLPYTETALFGATRNPWDLERTPGGSSGGSAALCAAGVVPVAHGNDMGGSLRIPASCTGIFGFKPSRGRVPTSGGLIGDANVDLAVSRSVRDSAALFDAVRNDGGDAAFGHTSGDPRPLRIALVRGNMLGHGISAEAREAADRAAKLCESLGHTVVEDEPAGVDYNAASYALLLMFASQTGWHLGSGNPTPKHRLGRDDIEPVSSAMLTIARTLPLDEITGAVATQRAITAAYEAFMEGYDAMLMPTLAAPAVRIGELALKKSEIVQIGVLNRLRVPALIRKAARDIAARMFDWLPYTPVFNLTGQPAMSVPLHWTSDGLPMGVQFAGRVNDDETLYALAGQLERAQPWFDRRPPIV